MKSHCHLFLMIRFGQLSVVILIFTLLASCSTSPKGRTQLIFVPDNQMSAMGIQAFSDLKAKTPIEKNPAINQYVQCVSQAIIHSVNSPHLPKEWEVVVFRDDTPNAFALPGGKIGVHTGMLPVARTSSQLAAVIGHEVGHVIARHGSERLSEQFATQGGLLAIQTVLQTRGNNYGNIMAALGLGAQFGLLLPHSRTQEQEADLIGLDLMAKAGFNPQGAIELWHNMESSSTGQPPEFLSTHPSHGTRIRSLNANLDSALSVYQSIPTRQRADQKCVRPSAGITK